MAIMKEYTTILIMQIYYLLSVSMLRFVIFTKNTKVTD